MTAPARAWTAFSHSPPSSAPRWWRRASTRRVKRAPRTGRSAPPRPLPTSRSHATDWTRRTYSSTPSPFPCRRAWSSRAATASRPSRRFDASRLSYRACAPFSDFRTSRSDSIPPRARCSTACSFTSAPKRASTPRSCTRQRFCPSREWTKRRDGFASISSTIVEATRTTRSPSCCDSSKVSRSRPRTSLRSTTSNSTNAYADASSRAHELASRTTSPRRWLKDSIPSRS